MTDEQRKQFIQRLRETVYNGARDIATNEHISDERKKELMGQYLNGFNTKLRESLGWQRGLSGIAEENPTTIGRTSDMLKRKVAEASGRGGLSSTFRDAIDEIAHNIDREMKKRTVEEFDEKGDIHSKGSSSESEDDFIEFSYKPGDTFGQKILDLGIGTDNGLWGDNGDVAFYTKQLIDGGYLDANGNVKLGVPIRLKRRK